MDLNSRRVCLFFLLLCLLPAGGAAKGQLHGPYLGQAPPGKTPELFAPGIVTSDTSAGCSGWGPNMEWFVFQRWVGGKSRLYIMNNKNGVWSEPEPLPFGAEYNVGDFTIAPDGVTMVFASQILIEEIGAEGEGGNVWFSVKSDEGWSKPDYYRSDINTKYHDSYPSLAGNKNMYFFSRRPGGHGDSDLYAAEFIGGRYQDAKNMGPLFNTEYHEWDAYIAPDESYLIFCSTKPEGYGRDDLYVAFKSHDGSWQEPVNMGEKINTPQSENRPYVTADGKYLFYSGTIRGVRDIYWVDADVIDDLRKGDAGKAYLGQAPPGLVPEIFAPGFVSTEKSELNSVFTPDGKEFYYSIRTPGKGFRMYVTKEEGGGWTDPRPVSFSGEYSDVDMFITADGLRMYFGSQRPVSGGDNSDFRIWYVEREGGGWGRPQYLDAPVNDGERALYATISRRGTMFFQAIRDEAPGNRDIYYSLLVDGKYSRPVHMDEAINSEYGEGDVFIAPDESYVIVNSNGRPDDGGGGDLYISFRNEDGTWRPLENMGEGINSERTDYCPMLSPDGKYLFFTSRRTGNGDIYWVDAKIIDSYR